MQSVVTNCRYLVLVNRYQVYVIYTVVGSAMYTAAVLFLLRTYNMV